MLKENHIAFYLKGAHPLDRCGKHSEKLVLKPGFKLFLGHPSMDDHHVIQATDAAGLATPPRTRDHLTGPHSE